jgi:hypothetical protein
VYIFGSPQYGPFLSDFPHKFPPSQLHATSSFLCCSFGSSPIKKSSSYDAHFNDYYFMLFVVQCFRIVASYILSSFITEE